MKRIRLSVLLFFFLCGCTSPKIDIQKTATITPTVILIDTPIPSATPALAAGSTQISPVDGMPLVYVPSGKFTMGSETYADEKPQRMLNLEAYWIDQTEVTNAMYARCVAAGGCKTTENDPSKKSGYEKIPVETEGWEQAQAYCSWAGRRLPTETEWEKAARGTDGRTYPWGEEIDCSKANYAKCKDEVQPVGSYPKGASQYGALDMAGNRWEWVADVYPGSKQPLLKGGDWESTAWGVRSAVRGGDWEAKGRLLWGSSMDVPWYDCYGTRTDWYCDFRGNTDAMGGGFRCALTP